MSNEEDPDSRKRKRFIFHDVVRQAVEMESMKRWAEPFLRQVVQEEIDRALQENLRCEEVDSLHSRVLKMKFCGSFVFPVFAGGARIDAEDSIKVALVDSKTGDVVCSGPESSARVEIVVLNGDFDAGEEDLWTREEFEGNIVREREGRKPLLCGECVKSLSKGLASLGALSFTDNSSWTRSRKFRLGVRVLDQFNLTRIKEAKTESFAVRDHRGQWYKKHHPPSLSDEVWRLEKIGKNGAFHRRLQQANIATVQDFLKMLVADCASLRHILGMSGKTWEATEQHARTCVVDKRVYLYQEVAFNAIGQVVGLQASPRVYVPANEMSESQTEDARRSVARAYDRWDDVISFEDEASLICCERWEPYDVMKYGSNVAACDSSLLEIEELPPLSYFGDIDLSYFEERVANEEAPGGEFQSRSVPLPKLFAIRRWNMIWSVMKWFYVRRIVAMKKAELFS